MSIDSLDLRHAFSAFATGVAVVTARTTQGRSFGITINSLASLSLDPPLLLWNLRIESKIHELWQHVEAFSVNVLSAQQMDVCRRFATAEGNQMQPGEFVAGPTGIPRLRDCIAHYDCAVEATYPGGDHTINVGRVLAVDRDPTLQPLIVFGSRLLKLDATADDT